MKYIYIYISEVIIDKTRNIQFSKRKDGETDKNYNNDILFDKLLIQKFYLYSAVI